MPVSGAVRFRSGVIRILSHQDAPLLRAHLLRLDAASRRNRFNGVVDDDFVSRYAATCFEPGVAVLGYLEDGAVRAAAELHAPHRSPDETPEIAFSVETHLRRKGVGSALFEALLAEAIREGYRRLRVTTGAQNDAMRALARKFGTGLLFGQGELSGTIDLTDRVTPLAPAA